MWKSFRSWSWRTPMIIQRYISSLMYYKHQQQKKSWTHRSSTTCLEGSNLHGSWSLKSGGKIWCKCTFRGHFFCASFPAPFFAMSELGEALEADAIIQALGVFFFPTLFARVEHSDVWCELGLKLLPNYNWFWVGIHFFVSKILCNIITVVSYFLFITILYDFWGVNWLV